MNRKGVEIIRGDDNTVTMTLPSGKWDTLIGATAYLTIKPESALDNDTLTDDAAIVKIDKVLDTEDLDVVFEIPRALTEDKEPGEYLIGGQIKDTNDKVTTVIMKPDTCTLLADINRRT